MIRRVLAATLIVAMALGGSPALAQQANGVISGRANDEAKAPYTAFAVQLRDAVTGQVVLTTPLNAEGRFAFENVNVGPQLLVELYNSSANRVVCTEGPYALTAAMAKKTDVNIDCGQSPEALTLLLLLAAGGTAAAIGLTRGDSGTTTPTGTPTVTTFGVVSASQ